ncbi:hypothetical protein HDU93_008918, partial [Gonapodya sp. JEL0774]
PMQGPGHGIIRTHNIQTLSRAARKDLRRTCMVQAAGIGILAPLEKFVLSTTSVMYNPAAANTKAIAFPLPAVLPNAQPTPVPGASLFIPLAGNSHSLPRRNRANLSVTTPSRPSKNGKSVKDLGIAAYASGIATNLRHQLGLSSESDSDLQSEIITSVKPKIINVSPGPLPYSFKISTKGASVVMGGNHEHRANPTLPVGTTKKRSMSPPSRLIPGMKSASGLDNGSQRPSHPNSTTRRDAQVEQGSPYQNMTSKDSNLSCKSCDYLAKHIMQLTAERDAHNELSGTFRDALLVLMRVVKQAMDERRSDGNVDEVPQHQHNSSAVVNRDGGSSPMDMDRDREGTPNGNVPDLVIQNEEEVSANAGTLGEPRMVDIGDRSPIKSASPVPDQTSNTTPTARLHLFSVLSEFGLSMADIDSVSILTGVDLLEVVGRHVKGSTILSGRTALSIVPDATGIDNLADGTGLESEANGRVASRLHGMIDSHDEDELQDMEVVWVQSESGHWGLGLQKTDKENIEEQENTQKKRRLAEQASPSSQAPKARKTRRG